MGELAPQVTPPRAMDFGPAEDLLDPAVIDRDQVRALARQELPAATRPSRFRPEAAA